MSDQEAVPAVNLERLSSELTSSLLKRAAESKLSPPKRAKLASPAASAEEPAPPGHPARGLSVGFLADEFIRTFSIETEEKVIDIEPRVTDFGRAEPCPRDNRMGAAYVDIANDADAGRSDFMLSYSWGYCFKDIVSALCNFCALRNIRGTKVWICFVRPAPASQGLTLVGL